jgi:hypothetical protein
MCVQREPIEQIEQLGTVVEVEHGMLSQHAEPGRRQAGPALCVVKLEQRGRMTLEHCEATEDRHRMRVANPVALRADQRGDGRDAVRSAGRVPIDAKRDEILQQPLLVSGFVSGMLFEVLDERLVRETSVVRRRSSSTAATMSGPVARTEPCIVVRKRG